MTALLNLSVFCAFLSISKNELTISGIPDVGRIGEEYIIKCTFNSSKGTPKRIRWIRNNSVVAIISARQCSLSEELQPGLYTYECNVDSSTYYLKIPSKHMTKDENNTGWDCSDDNQYQSNTFRLEVIGIKEFKEIDITLNKSIHVSEFESIILRCSNGMESSNGNRTYIKQNRMMNEQETYLLNYTKTLIQNITCFDTGIYKCNDRTIGKRSNSAKIVVFCIPIISNTSKIKNIRNIGEKLHLFAYFLAYPKPKVKWTFKQKGSGNKRSITNGRRFSIHTREIDDFLKFTKLTNSEVKTEDFGEYELRLENVKGSKVELFTVEQNSSNFKTQMPLGIAIPVSLLTVASIAITVWWKKCKVVKRTKLLSKKENTQAKEDYDVVKRTKTSVKGNKQPVEEGYDGSYRNNTLYVSYRKDSCINAERTNGKITEYVYGEEIPDDIQIGPPEGYSYVEIAVAKHQVNSETDPDTNNLDKRREERESTVSEFHYEPIG